MRGQHGGCAFGAREHRLKTPPADAFTMTARVHVQLGELEGVVEPVARLLAAGLLTERARDDVVPPVAGPAVVAVAEADDRVIRIARQHADEAAAVHVRSHDFASLHDELRRSPHRLAVDDSGHRNRLGERLRTDDVDGPVGRRAARLLGHATAVPSMVPVASSNAKRVNSSSAYQFCSGVAAMTAACCGEPYANAFIALAESQTLTVP